MTRGLRRYHESKQSHFVTFSCYRRQVRFSGDELRNLFLSSLENTRRKYRLCIYGYVVMPEHVHLLVSEPERRTLATAIQALKVSVAKLARAPRAGEPFWQKRSYDHNIRSYAKFVEKLRYIHRNPVKRGLVARPEDWPWSSFRHYAFGEIGIVEIESERTARLRASAPLNPP